MVRGRVPRWHVLDRTAHHRRGDLLTNTYIQEYRELDVSTSASLNRRMEETADRIIERDKRHHTGGSGMVIRIQATQGELRFPYEPKARR